MMLVITTTVVAENNIVKQDSVVDLEILEEVKNINEYNPLLDNSFDEEQDWVDGFVDGGTITSGYCKRKRNGIEEEHPAVDIGKKVGGKWVGGVDVKAGIEGEVVAVYKFSGTHTKYDPNNKGEWLKNFNTVVIKGKDGNFHLYCHLSEIKVNVGDKVTKNTVVGKMGGMGSSCAKTFGPHLHYEIREDIDNDGTWNDKEMKGVVTGTKVGSVKPAYGENKNTNSAVEGGHIGGDFFEYTVTNWCVSTLDISYVRINYDSSEPYVALAPVGWEVSDWDESPGCIEWYSTDFEYNIPPCYYLDGFRYSSSGTIGYVDFFTANDDAGHGGFLPTKVRVEGVASDSEDPVVALESPIDGLITNEPNIDLIGMFYDDQMIEDIGYEHIWSDGATSSLQSIDPVPAYDFNWNLSLHEGENIITAHTADISDNWGSKTVIVFYDTTPLDVDLINPVNGFYLFGYELFSLPGLIPELSLSIIVGEIDVTADTKGGMDGIEYVLFTAENWMGGSETHLDFTYPYEWNWNGGTGIYIIAAEAKNVLDETIDGDFVNVLKIL